MGRDNDGRIDSMKGIYTVLFRPGPTRSGHSTELEQSQWHFKSWAAHEPLMACEACCYPIPLAGGSQAQTSKWHEGNLKRIWEHSGQWHAYRTWGTHQINWFLWGTIRSRCLISSSWVARFIWNQGVFKVHGTSVAATDKDDWIECFFLEGRLHPQDHVNTFWNLNILAVW
jgi:hypothetical protein